MFNWMWHKLMKCSKTALASLLVLFILAILMGCSATSHYKTLSFFFDGVPNPESKAANQPADSLKSKDSTSVAGKALATNVLYLHPPYQSKECGTCHDQTTSGRQVKPMPELCYECHEDFKNRYKVLHGPVGGGQCIACHNPHMSTNGKLMLRTGQDICLFCHESAQVMKSDAHQDIKDVNCTECHNPHGGEDRYVLK